MTARLPIIYIMVLCGVESKCGSWAVLGNEGGKVDAALRLGR